MLKRLRTWWRVAGAGIGMIRSFVPNTARHYLSDSIAILLALDGEGRRMRGLLVSI